MRVTLKGFLVLIAIGALAGWSLPARAQRQSPDNKQAQQKPVDRRTARQQQQTQQQPAQRQERVQQQRSTQQQQQQRAQRDQQQRVQRDQQQRAQRDQQQRAQQQQQQRAQRDQQQRVQRDQQRRAKLEQQQRAQREIEQRGRARANGQRVAEREIRRLPRDRQDQLIREQRQRSSRYDQRLRDEVRLANQRLLDLERHHRSHQHRFHALYFERLRQQQIALINAANYDYYNDPYFYSAPIYRYLRSGRYYQINEYGADLLRQALNAGYEEGYLAGQADREDGWRYDYEGCYAYQDANYGYSGYYIDQSEYNYYFREGFRRGYEDGYYGRYRYGSKISGVLRLLDGVLLTVLRFESLY
jgi:hypothetical protein